MKTFSRLSILVLAATNAATGCVDDGRGDETGSTATRNNGPETHETAGKLGGFATESEFDEYLASLKPKPHEGGGEYDAGAYDDESAAGGSSGEGEASAAAPEEPANENITNTQEVGVDEGGIVKNIGDLLVVLRHGRIHVIDTATPGTANQVDVMDVAADASLNQGVWYDEMLVSGRELVVVGYRYAASVVDADEDQSPLRWIYGATELTRFTVGDDGQLERGGSTWLESNDYYSGTNYASRLVDGEVILYMPYSVFVWSNEDYVVHQPRVLEHRGDNQFVATAPLFDWEDVLQMPLPPQSPVFHTVVRCPMAATEGATGGCTGKSLLAEGGATMYVSSQAIYLWGDVVARFDLSDGTAAVHSAGGYPRDQFAFKDTGDTLHAVVSVTGPLAPRSDAAPGENVGEPDIAGEPFENFGSPDYELRHLILPVGDFDGVGRQPLPEAQQPFVHALESGYVGTQRFVGGRYLASLVVWPQEGDPFPRLVSQALDGTGTQSLEMSGYVSRIEALGAAGALLVWADVLNGLHLDTLPEVTADAPEPAIREGRTLPGASEGESRSHGFFFKREAIGGLFGLAVMGQPGDSEAWYGSGSSNLAFFSASDAGEIEPAGTVSAGVEAGVECEVSCVDWYGNTRPIFLRDRIFALMGDELAELSRDAAGALAEIGERATLSAQ